MHENPPLSGVFAAAVTPLKNDFSPDYQAVPEFLSFLARRGCHGALLFGTTGEGPSFAPSTRLALLNAVKAVRQEYPTFKILLGTGTPSLEETITLTRAAFENEVDGVVVLPPYYFRKASDDGLYDWFSTLLQEAVPDNGCFLAYHIPSVSGVPITPEILSRLKDNFPDRFHGLKDSSGDPEHAQMLGERFGKDLIVLNGSDRLFTHALRHGAAGCITAMANLYSPDLRLIWDAFKSGSKDDDAQDRLVTARLVMDRYPPAAPLLKALLAKRYELPLWPVCPPLLPCPEELVSAALEDLP